jgi:hypothetical protein
MAARLHPSEKYRTLPRKKRRQLVHAAKNRGGEEARADETWEGSSPITARGDVGDDHAYAFLKIFVVVVLALALIDWLADRDRPADTNIPNATPGWAFLSGDIKIAESAIANEKGTVPPGQSFLQVTSNTRVRKEMSVSISQS